MSAPIVYEGAARPSEPLRNGMFKGDVFWVAHRVPRRLDYIDTIKKNGGKIVVNEKLAHYIIADPLMKDIPSKSYSYRLIDDSIKNGALQDPDKYLCRATVPQKSQKGTRTPYTKEDDMILRQWIAQCQKFGRGISGNAIYQELEQKHPHHTWNSWRDRWVKKLCHIPQPEVPDVELSPPQARQTAEPPPVTSPSQSKPSRATEPRRTSTQNPPNPRGRTKFTKEDDDILIQHIRECVRHNKPTSGQKVFHDLATDFPHHTEQSWRERWVKNLKLKNKDKLAQWEAGEISDELSEAEAEAEAEPAKGHGVDQGLETTETAEQRQVLQTRKDANINSTRPQVDKSHMRRVPNVADEIPTQNVTEMKKSIGTSNQDDFHQQRSPTKIQEKPQPQAHVPEDASIDVSPSPSGDRSMKDQFLIDYQIYANAIGIAFAPFLTIKGRTFELWDLWQAIASQKMVPEERDWQQIAEKLGFDWVQHETIHDELRECYETHLAEFENDRCLSDLEYESESESDGEGEGEDEDEEAGQETEAPLPSSPPMLPSLKRSYDTAYLSAGLTYPQSSPKRRRIDRNGEVPSTPDHVNGTSHLRRQGSIDATPNKSADQSAVDDAEDDEFQDAVQELPALPRGRKKAVEPETQDFRFDPETQDIIFETEEDAGVESQSNITPSQQLHQESDAISAGIWTDSPTPKANASTSIQNTNPITPTPRRSRRIPFRQESDDRTPEPVVTSSKKDAPASPAVTAKAKRRSLPKSWVQDPAPTNSTPASASRQQVQLPLTGPAQPVRRSVPAQETPEDVIDRFCSLGYPRNIVLQALRATTWRLGDAGQVMEMLKQGQELPQRTHGVWTQRDDDALKLAISDELPRDEKEGRKRARARKRLEEKHGTALMELRRKYLWETV